MLRGWRNNDLCNGLHDDLLRGGQSTPKLLVDQPFSVYFLYSVLIVTFFLVMSPVPGVAGGALPEVHRQSLGQRLGYLPISFNLDGEESIWIHAVSVGEVLTARALLPQLRERYPRLRICICRRRR